MRSAYQDTIFARRSGKVSNASALDGLTFTSFILGTPMSLSTNRSRQCRIWSKKDSSTILEYRTSQRGKWPRFKQGRKSEASPDKIGRASCRERAKTIKEDAGDTE